MLDVPGQEALTRTPTDVLSSSAIDESARTEEAERVSTICRMKTHIPGTCTDTTSVIRNTSMDHYHQDGLYWCSIYLNMGNLGIQEN